MTNQSSYGKVILLVGKVACGKTTYARKMEEQSGVIFLSLDELQLAVFGQTPTREQLDDTYTGCCEYQKHLALKLVKSGLDIYLDWGFWQQSARQEVRCFFEKAGCDVVQYYFDIPEDVRYARNRKRNLADDTHSFKIEEKDITFFDGFFEAPELSENDKVFTV
ncbi:ATP-binding protein [Psychromonas sp. PT13]|uniref:ATP-binding protein n=1 Tax=Psychromonas sp. PT13 TaxID=3439547 RepID=UPI003EB80818